MRTPRTRMAWFALALLGAAGLGAWQGRSARDEAAPARYAPETTALAAATPTTAFADAPSVPTLPSLPPLPPASMRLGEAWPALEARALAGDWHAGCRLADALSACRAREDASLRQVAGGAGDALRALDAFDCTDVPRSLVMRRAIYRLAAARAGHRRSAETFIAGTDFPHDSLFDAAADPAILAYREHYNPIRMALLEQGSLEAARGSLAWDYRMRGEGPSLAEQKALNAWLDMDGTTEGMGAEAGASDRVRRWLERIPPEHVEEVRQVTLIGDTAGVLRDADRQRLLGVGDGSCLETSP